MFRRSLQVCMLCAEEKKKKGEGWGRKKDLICALCNFNIIKLVLGINVTLSRIISHP